MWATISAEPKETECIYVPRGRRGRDRMVVGYTITYAINAYHL